MKEICCACFKAFPLWTTIALHAPCCDCWEWMSGGRQSFIILYVVVTGGICTGRRWPTTSSVNTQWPRGREEEETGDSIQKTIIQVGLECAAKSPALHSF